MSKTALIIGGTRGIGLALATRLTDLGWDVKAMGSKALNLTHSDQWGRAIGSRYDLLVFSAGELNPAPWQIKTLDDLVRSYVIHAAAPLAMLGQHGDKLLGWWSKVVFISTVGAVNSGAVDIGYGMAKAALEKAAKALEEHTPWGITLVRFDLVDTNMIRLLPADTMHGRPILSVEEAAEQIVQAAKLEE
jgi:NAD(P)-dependent dehydrogenase (short-subunit alcohol dehydrogenase family)